MDDKEAEKMPTDDLPKQWPDHFEDAIWILNWHLLPSLKFSSKELMMGLVVNTKPTNLNNLILPITENNTALQMAYVAQQRLDGYAEAIAHALKRKMAFDRRVLAQKPGEVIFSKGQLVQIYRNDLDYTLKTERKLLPKWSTPHCIASQQLNSYTLETLNRDPVPGSFSTRCLRHFIPREGTTLAEEQRAIEIRIEEEEQRKRQEVNWTQEPENIVPSGNLSQDMHTGE